MKLPSKKVMFISGLCLCVLVAALILKYKQGKDFGTYFGLLTPSGSSSTPLVFQDKSFYESSGPKTATGSLTDNISRDFFLNIVDLQNKGKLTVDSEAELIDNITNTYAAPPKLRLTQAELTTFSDREKERVRAFGNSVAVTLKTHNPSLKTSPLDIIGNAMDGKISTSSVPALLAPMSRAYRLLVKDLLKIPVPVSLAPTYLGMINTFDQFANNIDDMSAYFNDPARGFFGITRYQANFINQVNLLKSTADYFKTNGILFNDTEDGRMWTSLAQ